MKKGNLILEGNAQHWRERETRNDTKKKNDRSHRFDPNIKTNLVELGRSALLQQVVDLVHFIGAAERAQCVPREAPERCRQRRRSRRQPGTVQIANRRHDL